MPKYQESFTFTAIGTEPNQETFDKRIWEIFMPVLDVQLKAYGYELFYRAKRNDYIKSNPYLHSIEVKEKISMLKMEDIKEGDILICINNAPYNINAYKIGTEYKVIKEYNKLYIDRITPKHSEYNLCVAALTLTNFKLKQKETTMLDPEIYAIGTVHKNIGGLYSYEIIARDINLNNEFYMLVQDVTSKTDTMLISQETGKSIEPNSSYNLAITNKKIKGWINIYSRQGTYNNNEHLSSVHPTKSAADNRALKDRIACIEVEFEEGEGL